MKLPFILNVLWNPVDALDLRDAEDKPDHSKIVPFITLVTVLVFTAIGIVVSPVQMMILFSASYGYGAWRTFLKSRTVTAKIDRREVAEKIEHIVRIERDDENGYQATP